jgi:hypothetical protein
LLGLRNGVQGKPRASLAVCEEVPTVLGLLVGCTRLSSNALSLAEGDQLLEDCGALDLEEDFIVVVVCYFDVQMFADRLTFELFGEYLACRFRRMQTSWFMGRGRIVRILAY